MTLVKTNGLMPGLTRFFDDQVSKDLFDWSLKHFSNTNTTVPAVNILDSDNEYVVEMAAPGMKKGDFKIELDNNLLTISSQMESGKSEQEYLRREFSYQSFFRSFRLNDRLVEDQKIKATYQDGILRLVLPKSEEAKRKAPRQIAIK